MNNETTFSTIWASMVDTICNILSPHGAPLVEGGARTYVMGDYSIHFFLQIALIILTCRVVGWLGQKFLGQPQVVGEMIAGVIIGPSVIGYFFPEFSAALFPKATKSILYVGAQFGVGLYMFLVGTTFHIDHFKANGKKAFAVSFAGIAAPFLVAVLITPYLMTIPGLFAPTISTGSATLFLGACIALTAFPMLARIINERGLSKSSLGTLSLTAGAFDDACSWCVLAIVLATFGAGPGIAVLAIGGGILYSLFICFFGAKLLAPLGKMVEKQGSMSNQVLAIVFALFSLSAFIMDAVGIHAIFGGFILGTVMPRGKFVAELKKKVEPMAVVLFLPMFFTYSGLNTMMNVMNTPFLMLVALGVLVASVVAKGVACYVAARLCGEDNSTALAIGALMNSRGLMELIIINIGLEKGIIGQGLFSMLVLMAIVTTLMATPVFEFVYGRKARERGELGATGDLAADVS